MTLIYSSTKVDGLEGAYRNPLFFNGVEKAELVYTDNVDIAAAYTEAGIKALPLQDSLKGNEGDPFADYTEEQKELIKEALESGELNLTYKKDGSLAKKDIEAIEKLLKGNEGDE